jgi:hypothetical protein
MNLKLNKEEKYKNKLIQKDKKHKLTKKNRIHKRNKMSNKQNIYNTQNIQQKSLYIKQNSNCYVMGLFKNVF